MALSTTAKIALAATGTAAVVGGAYYVIQRRREQERKRLLGPTVLSLPELSLPEETTVVDLFDDLPPYFPSAPPVACAGTLVTKADFPEWSANLRNGIVPAVLDGGMWVDTSQWNFHSLYLKGMPPGSATIEIRDRFQVLAWRAYSDYQPSGKKYWASLGRKEAVAQVPWLSDLIGSKADGSAAKDALRDIGGMLGQFMKLQWAKLAKDALNVPLDWADEAGTRFEAAAALVTSVTRAWRQWIYYHPNNAHLRTSGSWGNTLELEPIFKCDLGLNACGPEREVRVGAGGCSPVVFLPLPPL